MQASDLHLSVGCKPMARLHGAMRAVAEVVLGGEACRDLILSALTEVQRSRLEDTLELDFAVSVEGIGRFRGNAHYCRGQMEAAFRHIPDNVPDLSTLGHRPAVSSLCDLEHGLVLVTGMTGTGKNTTMAAMVKEISKRRSGVIITIEDPIEFVYQNSLSIIKQREVGTDTKSFANALRQALRQDPDVILLGEMRDLDTAQAAITAAETGHLVLSTLHTVDAPKAVDRIVDAFPADQQSQIVAQLANSLQAVISQRLLPKADGSGRVLASEVLIANHAVRACLRDRRYEQFLGLMEIGAREGMFTIDDHVKELLTRGLISKEEAMINARDKERMSKVQPPTTRKGLFG